jgi:hypothetical protein
LLKWDKMTYEQKIVWLIENFNVSREVAINMINEDNINKKDNL